MPESNGIKRLAYTPGEFAEFFGKSQTWAYRQIYANKIKAISAHGRIIIPLSEVERILGAAEEYNGRKRKRKKKESDSTKAARVTKEELKETASQIPNPWQLYLQQLRTGKKTSKVTEKVPSTSATDKGKPAKPETPLARLLRRTNHDKNLPGA